VNAPRSEPETVNIMSPVDVALDLADSEAVPIQPSLPALESIHPEALASGSESTAPIASRRAAGVWAIVAILSVIVGVSLAVLMVSMGKKREPVARSSQDVPAAAAAPAPALPAPAPAAASAVTPQAPSAAPVVAAAAPKPEAAPAPSAAPVEPEDSSGERTATTPTCEQMVGPSWSLLSGDQPGRALAEIAIGRRALMLGKLEDAQVSFCRAAVLDPTKPDAFQALVRTLLLRRDANQALQWAERAAKQHPEIPEVQALYGDALARAGDVDHARTIWLENGHVDASDTAQIRGMAYTYAKGGDRAVKGADFAQADRLYRRAALLDPLNATAAAGLSRVLLVQAEVNAALHWAKRAVSLEPHDADLHIMLGDVLEKSGDLNAARAEWKNAYDLDPHNFRAASRMLRATR
jgi:tetratricopeptide (TPR) repeat protein